MVTIAEYINALQAMGIFNFYLPFFILFAIFYALLTKSGIFGAPESALARKINLIVALGASAYVLIYSPISGTALSLGEYLSTLFGQTFVIIMTFLAILIIGYVLLVPLGVEPREKGPALAKYFVGFLIILGIGLFISSGGFTYFITGWPGAPTFILPGLALSLEDIAIISLVVLTGLVIYWFVKPPKELMEVTPEERKALEAARKARKGG
jgi:hypothetical protein